MQRLSELSGRIQRLDISLNILEAKVSLFQSETFATRVHFLQLSSIPDLDGVQSTTQYEPPSCVASAGASTASGSGAAPAAQPAASSGPPPPVSQAGPTPSAAGDEPIPPPPTQPGQLTRY